MRRNSRVFFRDDATKESFVGGLRLAIQALRRIEGALQWAAALGWFGETFDTLRDSHTVLVTELDKLAIALREPDICYQTEVEGLYTV